MSGTHVVPIPSQVVTVGGAVDRSLVCLSVTYAPEGSTASIAAPLLFLSSDKSVYFLNEICVYAANASEDFGDPIFRGFLDVSRSNLRDGKVVFSAHSVYMRWRQRSTAIREVLTATDGLYRTFASAGYDQFLETNPYILNQEMFINWNPVDILTYFYNVTMEAEFKAKLGFRFDPSCLVVVPYEVSTFKWDLEPPSNPLFDNTYQPVLTATTKWRSHMGDQVIRLGSWGDLIDYIASMMPGVQVYEQFTSTGTEIWFAPPFKNGSIQATAGRDNLDWRAVGANITELSIESDVGGTVNRYIGIGAPASCTVTLMSNTLGVDGSMVGLIPDWEIFDPYFPDGEIVPRPIQGIDEFDYNTHHFLAIYESQMKQSFVQVVKNSGLGDPDSPSYRPGYEHVGRRWRLPNWFVFHAVERGEDMFSNPKSGYRVDTQVFIEKAVKGTDGNWKYEWMAYTGRVEFDWKRASFSMEEVPLSFNIIKSVNPEITPDQPNRELDSDGPNGVRLARVALTFTYSTRHYVPYADTLLDSGGVIDIQRLTAIQSGQPLLFERLDMHYSQLTNIGMPIRVDYGEYPMMEQADIEAGESQIYQEPVVEPYFITYSSFLVEAYKKGTSALKANVPDNGPCGKDYDEELLAPIVMRDDTKRLHQLAWDLLSWRGKRARSFEVKLGWLTKAARRGMMLTLGNVANAQNDWDCISRATHDLVDGSTSFVTTNQPGHELDILTIST